MVALASDLVHKDAWLRVPTGESVRLACQNEGRVGPLASPRNFPDHAALSMPRATARREEGLRMPQFIDRLLALNAGLAVSGQMH